MLTRVLAATVAGGVTFFVLGFIIYGLLLEERVMRPNMNTYAGLMNETPVWLPLILANLVSAFLLAYIFEQWAGIRTFIGGMRGDRMVSDLAQLSIDVPRIYEPSQKLHPAGRRCIGFSRHGSDRRRRDRPDSWDDE